MDFSNINDFYGPIGSLKAYGPCYATDSSSIVMYGNTTGQLSFIYGGCTIYNLVYYIQPGTYDSFRW